MFCPNCNSEINGSSKFCKICGSPLQAENKQPDNVVKKKSFLPIIIAAAAALLLALGILLFFLLSGGKDKKYEDKIALGDKYTDELVYDSAEAAYKEAIDIDPKRSEAYEALADLYLLQDDEEKALDILKKGYLASGVQALRTRINEIEKRSVADTKAVTPTIAPEPTPEPEELSKEIPLESIPNKNELGSFLSNFGWFADAGFTGSQDYDCKDPDPEIIFYIVTPGGACVNSGIYPVDEPITGGNGSDMDPLKKYDQYNTPYWAYPEKSADWILKNILNCDDRTIESLKEPWINPSEDEGNHGYLYNGYYYVKPYGVGDGFSVDFITAEKEGENRYTVYYVLYVEVWERYYVCTRKADVELKEIEGKSYWTIYSDVETNEIVLTADSPYEWAKPYLGIAKQCEYQIPDNIDELEPEGTLLREGRLYTLAYIDDDDIPELIVEPSSMSVTDINSGIFSYINGNAEQIVYTGGYGYALFIHQVFYKEKTGEFYVFIGGTNAESRLTGYMLKNGSLQVIYDYNVSTWDEYDELIEPEWNRICNDESYININYYETAMTYDELVEYLRK